MTLYDYLDAHKLDDATFAALVGGGCSEWAVRKWRYGQRFPRASMQRRITEVTKGAVSPIDLLAAFKQKEAA